MPDHGNSAAQPGQVHALQAHVHRRPPPAAVAAPRVHLQRHPAADGDAVGAVATCAVAAVLDAVPGGRRPDGDQDVDGVAGGGVLGSLLRLQAEGLA
jgi:hypothetical protein